VRHFDQRLYIEHLYITLYAYVSRTVNHIRRASRPIYYYHRQRIGLRSDYLFVSVLRPDGLIRRKIIVCVTKKVSLSIDLCGTVRTKSLCKAHQLFTTTAFNLSNPGPKFVCCLSVCPQHSSERMIPVFELAVGNDPGISRPTSGMVLGLKGQRSRLGLWRVNSNTAWVQLFE